MLSILRIYSGHTLFRAEICSLFGATSGAQCVATAQCVRPGRSSDEHGPGVAGRGAARRAGGGVTFPGEQTLEGVDSSLYITAGIPHLPLSGWVSFSQHLVK